ncbi:MAG TPA: hypothetical protein VMX76_01170 [Nevskiaceae bacterium]|nr:hypothetical protein [Nevskiaceae bacterium]
MAFNKSLYQKIALADVILRLILGPAIFISVCLAALFTFLLDWVDGEFFKRAGYPQSQYSFYDKLLDYYWYIFILIYIFLYQVPSKNIFLFLFLFRSLGQALFFLTKKEFYFIFFPNVFEILFYFYLFTTILPKWQPLMFYPQIAYPLIIITLVVLIREYVLHIKKMNLSGFFTGKTTYWVDDKKKNVGV